MCPCPTRCIAIPSREYPGFNMNIPDQFRATQFIGEMDAEVRQRRRDRFRGSFSSTCPTITWPTPRPEDGYPYEASFVADNDYALGRIDRIPLAHAVVAARWRSLLPKTMRRVAAITSMRIARCCWRAGRIASRNYVSHVNTSFPGLLKTIFRLLGIPPLNLFDAAASDLSDCFTDTARLLRLRSAEGGSAPVRPSGAKEPLDPKPSPRMDDPREVKK